MEKNVTPVTTPNPTAPAPKPIPKKIRYRYAGKETLSQSIGRAIPKQLIPTKRIGTIFGAIFILVLIIAAFQFPLGSLMSGNIDTTIKVGYPWTFLELALTETDTSPIKAIGFTLDLLLYIILAYAIDIIIGLTLKNPLLQSEEERNLKPKIFKNREPSITEKVAEKVTEKVTKEKIIK